MAGLLRELWLRQEGQDVLIVGVSEEEELMEDYEGDEEGEEGGCDGEFSFSPHLGGG